MRVINWNQKIQEGIKTFLVPRSWAIETVTAFGFLCKKERASPRTVSIGGPPILVPWQVSFFLWAIEALSSSWSCHFTLSLLLVALTSYVIMGSVYFKVNKNVSFFPYNPPIVFHYVRIKCTFLTMRPYMIYSHTSLWIHHLPPFPHPWHSNSISLLGFSSTDWLIPVLGTLHAHHLGGGILPPDPGMDGSFSSLGLCLEVIFSESLCKCHHLPPSPTLISDFLSYHTVLFLHSVYQRVTSYCLLFLILFILSSSAKNVNATRVPHLPCSLQYTSLLENCMTYSRTSINICRIYSPRPNTLWGRDCACLVHEF